VTVYAQFGDRDALLEAVYDDLAASGGLLRIPEVFAASDTTKALDTMVGVFCHFYTVHRAVIRRLHALSAIDSMDLSSHGARDARRRDIISALLRRPGVADDRLGDMLQALTSFAFVDELAGQDRSPDEVAGQVAALVAAAIASVELARDAHEEGT
jgi:AcrR family transcriptional regulator